MPGDHRIGGANRLCDAIGGYGPGYPARAPRANSRDPPRTRYAVDARAGQAYAKSMREIRDLFIGFIAGGLIFLGGWQVGLMLRSEVRALREGRPSHAKPPWLRGDRMRMDQCARERRGPVC